MEVIEEVAPLTQKQRLAVGRCFKALKQYGATREFMVRAARAIVNLRLTFEVDGRPDYAGESAAYKAAVSEVYKRVIDDEEERAAFKVAIRYWISKEFTARVNAGEIKSDDLLEAGLEKPMREPTARAPKPSLQEQIETLVTKQLESDDPVAPVAVLQTISRELGPVVAVLRDEARRSALPKRSFHKAAREVLGLALDMAAQADIDVEEFAADWFAQSQTGGALATA